ncbi:transglutaminase domain-containing protein [Methylomonas sp. MED-D]|uniref:Cysteine protease n=1 Tax=Methylomonas koyamae TaxID=702114 RepID=A0A177NYI9_9GAMM|nr:MULTISPECIES: transglutaminase family protein [Methylomonas]NJA06127.1 transglutaminase family protein [Methylococcaceae bacterium WWC4]MDT4328678.1 transglutaminase family protein [Methylomonas sp. MV1]OAI22981.1 cysteine protease [Methylomonas koyamae]OHX34444.1 cysteine protease [Methylomonas sp. LWB]WGS88089.1 transglutaminase family protein [Methylomonas sp. UP202]
MWLRTSCDICFEVGVPTPFILMLRPRSGANQWISSEFYTIKPTVQVLEYTDGYGNLCQRLIAPPGILSIHTNADIRTSEQVDVAPGAPFEEVQTLPDTVLTYLLPSRYCESDRFIDLAQEIVRGYTPGYDQVDAVNGWLRANIRFNPAAGLSQLSAVEVNLAGEGVCRDLAHLGIALCRALCIPARMVVGYLYGLRPMDFHAWFEAYVGGRWYAFDPTQREPRGGRVIVAYGHDAADVAVFTQFGPPLFPTRMAVGVERLANARE